jgi:hypothetical protein
MMYVILQWLFVTCILTIFGLMAYRLLLKFQSWQHIEHKQQESIPFWVILASGAASLTAVLLWLHIFVAIGIVALQIVLLIGLVYLALDRKFVWHHIKMYSIKLKSTNILAIIIFVVFFFAFASHATNYMTTYDTWLYHDQAVKWAEQYPAVPGIGNLHTRLGLSTSYFVTNAFFDNSKTYVFSSFLYVLLLLIACSGMHNLLKRQINFASVLQTSLFVTLIVFIKDLPSLSNDVGGSIFLFATICAMLLAEVHKSQLLRLFAVCIGLYTVTIKLTFAPLGILAVYVLYLFVKEKKYVGAFTYFGSIGLLLYVPFFIRNIIQSGYLVYPFKYIDIFSLDWKVPLSLVISDTMWIQSWARMPGVSPDIVLGNGFWFWFSTWLKVPQNMFYIQALVLCVLVFFVYLIANKHFRHSVREYIWVYITSVCLVLFWFTQAPDLRFGYGALFMCIVLLAMGLFYTIVQRISEHVPVILYFICIIGLLIIFFQVQTVADSKPQIITVEDANKMILTVQGQSRLLTVSETLLNGTQRVYMPLNGDWCLTSPLPCTPYYENGTTFYMRGNSLRDGFASYDGRS